MVLYRKLLLLIFNVGLQKKFFGENFQQYKKFYLKVIFTRNLKIVKYFLIIEEKICRSFCLPLCHHRSKRWYCVYKNIDTLFMSLGMLMHLLFFSPVKKT